LLALTVTTRPGDTIAAEGLTYPGLKFAAGQRGLKTVGLPMDDKGILPDEFANQCKLNNIRTIYLCPSIQNPTNASMDDERRNQILDIASRYNVWIIEDEITTNYADQNKSCFANLSPDRTFHINSHSKTIAPGLRVGYLISPPKLKDSVAATMKGQCWFAPTLNVEIVQRFLDTRESKTWISVQKKELKHRHDLVRSTLGRFNIRLIAGSYHAWLVLPEPWRALEFQSQLLESGIQVLPSESFAGGRFPAPQAIRISMSGPETIGKLEKGLILIKDKLDDGYDPYLSAI
jgi:DNA-binding transcriptional MocR family regulator